MKVGEALRLFASFYRRTVDQASLLREWGLEDKRTAAFAELSGGQRQRLFIALALLNDPEVVVFDELTTGLDPQVRRATWELLGRIRQRGTTVVLVTHAMEEAERLCDRVAIIDRGRVVALDRPAALVAQRSGGQRIRCTVPAGLDVSWLHGVAGVREVRLDGDQLAVAGEGPLMSRVSAALADHGLAPPDLRTERASLDDVFLALTGHEIR
jgi:ABC-2 type transport system ATP-binding protein